MANTVKRNDRVLVAKATLHNTIANNVSEISSANDIDRIEEETSDKSYYAIILKEEEV